MGYLKKNMGYFSEIYLLVSSADMIDFCNLFQILATLLETRQVSQLCCLVLIFKLHILEIIDENDIK